MRVAPHLVWGSRSKDSSVPRGTIEDGDVGIRNFRAVSEDRRHRSSLTGRAALFGTYPTLKCGATFVPLSNAPLLPALG
jgi:hypothetical protein